MFSNINASTEEAKATRALVMYHANCSDGWSAAWAHRHLKVTPDETTKYMASDYKDPTPWAEITPETAVYVYDFSFPREDMIKIRDTAASLLVLDHHKTAEANCKGLGEGVIFDQSRCGSKMAWEHHSKDPCPWLIDYVQDRDLWTWKLENSKEINAVIQMTDRTFENWDMLAKCNPKSLVPKGRHVLEYQAKVVRDICAQDFRTVKMKPNGLEVPVINTTTLMSETLHEATKVKKAPCVAGFFISADGKCNYSLRGDGSMDVSEIARAYGGGGHASAAGFTTDEILT